MDPQARHRPFVIGMAAIERNDTYTASCVHKLLGDPPLDQPHFLNADISGLREVPSDFPEFPQSEIPHVSDSSDSSPLEVQSSDSSVSDHSGARPWRRMGKKKSQRKVYKDSYSLESRVGT